MPNIKSKGVWRFIGKYAFLIPALLILAFTVFKAYSMSFTIDESTSYIFYARDTYKDIIECARPEANNHVLNSILMKFFSSWLPLSELALRLPSILAHVIFLTATWLLVKGFKNIWFRLAVYLFLNLNPYLLDFFSLARGYAMSWALMALSLYFLKQFMTVPNGRFVNIMFCFTVASLSMMASFPILDYYLALLAVYLIYDTWQVKSNWEDTEARKSFKKRVVVVLAISTISLYYAIHNTLRLYHYKFLYFGGDNGFWPDTVNSLIYSWIYNAPYKDNGILALHVFVLLIGFGSIVFLAYSFFFAKRTHRAYLFFTALFTILLLVILCITAQHYILGSKYVVQRTAAYILVLFLLLSAYLFNYVIPPRFRLAAAFLIGGIPLFHFAKAYTVSDVYEWKFDAGTKKMMQGLGALHQKQDHISDNLVFFHPFWANASTCMFYQDMYKYNWMLPVEYTNIITHSEDYYYLPDDTLNLLKGYKYKIIKQYPAVHETLIENLDKTKGTNYGGQAMNFYDTVTNNLEIQKYFPFARIDNIKCIKLDSGAFSPFLKFDAQILQHRSGIYVFAYAKVYFPVIKNGALAIAIYNKAGKILKWDSIDFGSYALQENGWMTIPFKIETDTQYPDADSIRVLVWNTGKEPIYASELRASIRGF